MRETCVCVMCAAALSVACSGSPTEPSASQPQILRGQTVSAIDGQSAASVSVQVGRERPVTSDVNGMFELNVEEPASYTAVLSSNAIVERRTAVNASAGDRVRLSVIPASFDLTAFDEMFRATHSRLQRWTTRPRLVVVATVMNYRAISDDSYIATSEQLTGDEVNTLTSHLIEGLAMLTGGTYTTFASVEVERPAEGARTFVMRPGSVVVGRYNGVVSLASTVGFGQWAEQSDGTVTGGAMILDRDFDRDDARRRLLRIHELGHALGYRHVTSRTSIMNPSIGPEPTEFDRFAATIAFQRPPGNRAPDTDPDSAPRSVFGISSGGRSVWAAPVFCGRAPQASTR
jgi:hypothetical protein